MASSCGGPCEGGVVDGWTPGRSLGAVEVLVSVSTSLICGLLTSCKLLAPERGVVLLAVFLSQGPSRDIVRSGTAARDEAEGKAARALEDAGLGRVVSCPEQVR